MTERTNNPHLLPMLTKCVERMDAMGYTGKKRADAALDFLCGWCGALAVQGVSDADNPTFIVFLVSIRGYREVIDALANARAIDAKQEG